ncbi:hypothetical protein H5410_003174 [Solanum commersonii]|uniref:Uncharacterized protein n=1 Tax=Solanum commersonii TaxID=4109 RepID=A0A9J6B426_SOLCO|nr:hypothetical protein H5410_003174 [Solanum commersonii]
MVHGKLITQGIDTNVKTRLHTFASVQSSSHETQSVALSVWASLPGALVWTWATVFGVTSEKIAIPDQLGAAIEVLVSDVWITDGMIVSLRLGKSP